MKTVQADRHHRGGTPRPLARITRGSIDVAGRQRSYTLAEPLGTGPGAALVLVFHGSKQTGEKFREFTGNSFDALAAAGGSVVAYLDGYKGHWNDARADVVVIEAVQDAVGAGCRRADRAKKVNRPFAAMVVATRQPYVTGTVDGQDIYDLIPEAWLIGKQPFDRRPPFKIFPFGILVIVDGEVPANRGPAVPLEHRLILPAWSRRSLDTRSLARSDALSS